MLPARESALPGCIHEPEWIEHPRTRPLLSNPPCSLVLASTHATVNRPAYEAPPPPKGARNCLGWGEEGGGEKGWLVEGRAQQHRRVEGR